MERGVGGEMAPRVRPVGLGSATLVLGFWLRKNSEPRLKLQEKVYLESHRGRRIELLKKWAQETSYRGRKT